MCFVRFVEFYDYKILDIVTAYLFIIFGLFLAMHLKYGETRFVCILVRCCHKILTSNECSADDEGKKLACFKFQIKNLYFTHAKLLWLRLLDENNFLFCLCFHILEVWVTFWPAP